VTSWPRSVDGLCYGGDYNPEQWTEAVWAEDVRLMREAGVNLVSVGIFSWALLEPAQGRFEFGWLDRVLDLLHDGGIKADLATATASPPPWLSRAYPESLPMTHDGRLMWPGGRQAFCPSSSEYRALAMRLVAQIATRYADHPALSAWHVHNEYGCHNLHCFCDTSADAFRVWLRRRYGDLDRLNEAWGTAFWSQHYGDWAEINPPRLAPTFANPTQQLDYWRFSSDELLDCFRSERDVLRQVTPHVPVTTNFMVSAFKGLDYWAWAREQDFVSNDHYLRAEGRPASIDPHVELALSADLTRSLAGGAPWLLMEHSTSAVNWQPRNLAKAPGQLRRNSLQHVARGADGVMFFQWRASAAGAEKYHSAMVPHAGTDTKIWREVTGLGAELRTLAPVRGSRVTAEVALLWDWEAWWGVDLDSHPSVDVGYRDAIAAWYGALWRAGITADFAHPAGDLSRYKLVLVPSLYLISDEAAAGIDRFVQGGGSLVVQFFSGIVDPDDHVRLGGYPGAFRDLLGIRVEEFFPLPAGDTVRLDDSSTGSVWTELVHAVDATVLADYVDGPVAGSPAITRRGSAWYVSTQLGPDDLARLLAGVCDEAGVAPALTVPAGVEAVRRVGAGGPYLFVLNHTDEPAAVAATGVDLLTGRTAAGTLQVPPGGVAVLRETGD
jgi:beta-galactosidase